MFSLPLFAETTGITGNLHVAFAAVAAALAVGLIGMKACDAVGRNPAHICRAFRSLLGCSVSEYGRAVRIERGAVLLRTTDHPVSHIAFDTGDPEAMMRAWMPLGGAEAFQQFQKFFLRQYRYA